jgi:hypothetical protein
MIRPPPWLLATALALSAAPADAEDWVRLPLFAATRLEPLYVVSEDGSKEQLGWYDTGRREACAFATAADGAVRCLPTQSVVVADTYLDAGCTRPAAPVTCERPRYVASFEPACASAARERISAAGAITVPAFVFESGADGCVRTANARKGRYVSPGVEIDPTAFSAGTIRVGRAALTLKLTM